LFGLSRKAIGRWVSLNQLHPESRIVNLVETTSAQLFFLANKSQQQICDENGGISDKISSLTKEISDELRQLDLV